MDHPVLLPICYLPSTEYYRILLNAPAVRLEKHEHFEKQTARTRCPIATANGRLNLTIPVQRKGRERRPMKDVRIANEERWQARHWRSITSAYRSSPYFEFYEDLFHPFYERRFEFLTAFSLALQEQVLELLGVSLQPSFTKAFEKEPENVTDLRQAACSSNRIPPRYPQVFEDRHGFLPHCSILDLLFNLGPETLSYLREKRSPPTENLSSSTSLDHI